MKILWMQRIFSICHQLQRQHQHQSIFCTQLATVGQTTPS